MRRDLVADDGCLRNRVQNWCHPSFDWPMVLCVAPCRSLPPQFLRCLPQIVFRFVILVVALAILSLSRVEHDYFNEVSRARHFLDRGTRPDLALKDVPGSVTKGPAPRKA